MYPMNPNEVESNERLYNVVRNLSDKLNQMGYANDLPDITLDGTGAYRARHVSFETVSQYNIHLQVFLYTSYDSRWISRSNRRIKITWGFQTRARSAFESSRGFKIDKVAKRIADYIKKNKESLDSALKYKLESESKSQIIEKLVLDHNLNEHPNNHMLHLGSNNEYFKLHISTTSKRLMEAIIIAFKQELTYEDT